MQLSFTVYGPPVGKQRPRFAGGRVYTPQETLNYEASVRMAAMAAARRKRSWSVQSTYTVLLRAFFKNNVRPDIDNVLKSVLDGMQPASKQPLDVVYDSDKRVIATCATVHLGDPRVEVTVIDQSLDVVSAAIDSFQLGAPR